MIYNHSLVFIAHPFKFGSYYQQKRGLQYSETNVMHFLFNLLRNKGLYMFLALLACPQEVLYKRQLVYCVSVMSVGCYQGWSGTLNLVAAN
jgi:hypothetical protein